MKLEINKSKDGLAPLPTAFFVLGFVCLIIGLGCHNEKGESEDSFRIQQRSENLKTQTDRGRSVQHNDTVTAPPPKQGPAATRPELDAYLSKHKNPGKWHYGERVKGELAGTWEIAGKGGQRVVFGADGTYRENFNGNMTRGLYAVSDEGRVVAFSKWNGIGLGAYYRLEGEVLVGPNGPNPRERWLRKKTSE